MPLFVRTGSILPMGPEIEYAAQDPAGPVEVRIYRGADGSFNLYEDAGDGDDYQKGQHSLIPLRWNDRDSVLSIGAREGSFPGMVEHRTFRIVVVGGGHGVAEAISARAEAQIEYDGKEAQGRVR